MKKVLLLLCVLGIAAMMSCTKEGPQGAIGPKGDAGKDGTNGLNGQDATVKCNQCHNNTTEVYFAQIQYELSKHATGETSFETGTSCAACHTNEGFNECVAAGKNDATAAIDNSTPVSCYTCHFVHKNYDATDLALKTTAPVKLRADANITNDFGKANLCATCHQSRVLTASSAARKSDGAVLTAAIPDADSVLVKSSRMGPHHGPQSNMIAGKGKSAAFEITGSKNYDNGPHSVIQNACITCHMAKSSAGRYAGGHTMKAVYEVEGEEAVNVNGCVVCHTGKTSDDMLAKIEDTQEEIQTLIDQLKQIFIDKGWYDTATDLWKASSTKPIKVTAKQAKAMYNYKFVVEDLSVGVHNPTYAKALLQNSIDAMQ